MADPTLADAISLLTKVSADTAQRLKSLEKEVRSSVSGGGQARSRGSTAPRVPRQIVEEPKDVVITNFGPEAEADLAAAFGRETKAVLEKQQEKNNSDLTSILKLLGVGAAVAALVDGQGIVGLVAGLQQVYKQIDKFAARAGKVLSKLGNRIASFAKSVGKKASSLLRRAGKAVSKAISSMGKMARQMVSRVGSKLKSVARGVKRGVKSAISKVKGIVKTISTKFGGAFATITSKLSSWGSSLMKGMDAAKKKAAEMAKKIAGSSAGKAVGKAASATKGFFSKAASAVASKVGGAAKAVGGAASSAASKAASVGSAVAAKGAQVAKSGAQAVKGVGKAVGAKALDVAKGALSKAAKAGGSILKILRFAAKSPLLLPVLEGIFAKKDINTLQDMYAAGEIGEDELYQGVGERGLKAVAGVLGGLGGAALGSFLGPIGAIGGGIAGDIGGRWIASNVIAPMMGDKVNKVGKWAIDSWMFKNYVPKVPGIANEPLAQIDDGIIFSKDGRALAQANPSDTIYAMKEGGPLLTTLATGFESNGKLLANLHEMHADHMATQIELDEERNSLLIELGKLLYSSLNPTEQASIGGTSSMQFAGMSVADSRSFPTAPV